MSIPNLVVPMEHDGPSVTLSGSATQRITPLAAPGEGIPCPRELGLLLEEGEAATHLQVVGYFARYWDALRLWLQATDISGISKESRPI